jgi:hypothetical protein
MRRTELCLSILLTLGISVSGQEFGTFVGEVVAKWDGNGRTMTLVEPFAYIEASGLRWDAPKGATVDGASIPQIAWSAGGPFEGQYRDASVIHDVACVEKSRHWRAVHRAFYSAMRARGVGTGRAKVMFLAVYHFGPRWTTAEGPPPPLTMSRDSFFQYSQMIQAREHSFEKGYPNPANPTLSLDDIERLAGQQR